MESWVCRTTTRLQGLNVSLHARHEKQPNPFWRNSKFFSIHCIYYIVNNLTALITVEYVLVHNYNDGRLACMN